MIRKKIRGEIIARLQYNVVLSLRLYKKGRFYFHCLVVSQDVKQINDVKKEKKTWSRTLAQTSYQK